MSDNSSEPTDRQQQLDDILAELMRAIDAGQSIDADHWLTRHPDFVTEIQEFFHQHERVEKLVRPLRQVVAHVLHVRCPHCHNPIELLEEARLEEISCPSCGSSFSLVGDRAQSHFPPGAKTLGHFELLDRVGVGQFGSVWKARDIKLDRTVAVKIPRNGRLDSTQTEMFLRDARAAAQLKHPNIVSVHEVGKQDDTVYIVSDFVRGADLKESMAANRLTPREAAELCIKIAKALHHAHEAGVIHRDLKPGNIMMDTAGEPHIVDFGLAKREAGEITMTVEGQILGTPAYMSPEQARGEGHTVDRRADIYSLGVVLFELLTGELPFRGDKQMLVLQILKDEPPSPRRLNVSVPRDLETICLKCLEKDPGKRYSNVCEVADDLDDAIHHRAIKARPMGRVARLVRWCRRNPLAATLFGVSGFAAAAVAGIMVGVVYQAEIVRYSLSLEAALVSSESANQVADRERRRAELAASVAQEQRARAQEEEKRATRQSILAEHAAALSRRYHYVSQIKLAQLALVEGRSRDTFLALDQLIPDGHQRDLRGIEWYYLWRKSGGPIHTFPGATAVRCVATSRDGQLAGVAHQNGVVVVSQLASGEELGRFELEGRALGLAFDRNSLRLYVAGSNGVVSAWNEKGSRLETVVNLGEGLEFASLANAGELLAAIAQGSDELKVYRCRDQETVYSGNVPRNVSPFISGVYKTQLVALNFNGDRVALATGGNVRILNLAADDIPQAEHLTDEHGPRVGYCVAISDDGQLVAAAEAVPARRKQAFLVKAWDSSRGDELCSFVGHRLPITAIAISHDRKRLATASHDQTIKIWDLEKKGEQIATFYGQTSFTTLAFDLDRKHLLVGDDDGTVRIWQLTAVEPSLVFQGDGRIGEVAFVEEGQWIVSNSHIWDLSTGRALAELTIGSRLAIDPEEKYVTDGCTLIELNNVDRQPTRFEGVPAGCYDVAFSTCGTQLATAEGQRGETRVVDIATGAVVRRLKLAAPGDPHKLATSVSFSPTGRGLLTATGAMTYSNRPYGEVAGEVKLWSLKTGKCLQEFSGHRHSVWRVVFDRAGRRIAAATGNYGGYDVDHGVWLWDAHTGDVLQVLRHNKCVFDVDFSPDGTRLASASGYPRGREGPGQLNLWDLETGQQLLTIETPRTGLCSVAFDDAGKQLAVGAFDGTVTVFRPKLSE